MKPEPLVNRSASRKLDLPFAGVVASQIELELRKRPIDTVVFFDQFRSACVPDSTVSPSLMTKMRSAVRPVARRWAMIRDVRPFMSPSSAC